MMKQQPILLIAAVLFCLNQGGQGETARPRSSVVQLPTELKFEDLLFEDINHDGLKDLVLSTSHRKTRFARSLRIHYQQQNGMGFTLEPNEVIALTPDVIAYACADTDPHAGEEVLLFTANACFGYRLQQENRDRVFKIASCEFLWQLPDPHQVFSWQGAVLDFNRDGRVDLFLPQSEGFRVWLQTDSGFSPTALLCPPEDQRSPNDSRVRVERDQSRISVGLGLDGAGGLFQAEKPAQPLVNVSHSINVPLFTHWNGDRYHDVLTQTSKHLHVWQQGTDEAFQAKPHLSLELPKDEKRDTGIDMSANQYVLDLNGDQRSDFVMFSRDLNSKKVFTQILIYLNHTNSDKEPALFGAEGIPQQLLKIAGLPSNAQWEDVNCDGYPDLSFVTFRPDLLDQAKTLASRSIEFQFLSFINRAGSFSRRPDLSQAMHMSLQEQGRSQSDQGRFFVDFNDDGLLDLLVRDQDEHIGLRLLRKTKNGMQIEKTHVWDMSISAKARIVYEKTQDKGNPVLLMVEPSQITWVRFQ